MGELFDFGKAINIMRDGGCVARKGWNGKDMFVFCREGRMIENVSGQMKDVGGVGSFESRPHFCMRAADGTLIVGWVATQSDMCCSDWYEVK